MDALTTSSGRTGRRFWLTGSRYVLTQPTSPSNRSRAPRADRVRAAAQSRSIGGSVEPARAFRIAHKSAYSAFVLRHKARVGHPMYIQPMSGRVSSEQTVATSSADRARETAILRELVTVYRHLSGLALQQTDVASVTQLLAERIAAFVAIVTPTLDVVAAADGSASASVEHPDGVRNRRGTEGARRVREWIVDPRLARVLTATGQARRALRLEGIGETQRSVIVAPILVGDEVLAYLLTFDDNEPGPSEDLGLLVTEHAATICGVILGRERVVAAAARQVRDDLVEGLLLGRGGDDAAQRWSQHLGYEQTRNHRVLSVAYAAGEESADQRLANAIEHFLATRVPQAITSARKSEVVAVVPQADENDPSRTDPRRLGSDCVARMSELFRDASVTIGIGGNCRDPKEIARSYSEARRTVAMLRRLGRRSKVMAFDDLGVHRLLLQVPDLAELRSFVDDVLGPIRARERASDSEYLSTLACYFRENNSPGRASRTLHVHPNTVIYRIKRVEEITGLRLDDYRDRLMLQLALEILDALEESS